MSVAVMSMTRQLSGLERLADYLITKKEEREQNRRHYSKTLGDYYRILSDGSMYFYESEVYFSKKELELLKGVSPRMLKGIYNIKKTIKGSEVIEL